MFLLLSYLGACHPEAPYVLISKLASLLIVLLLCMFKGLWVVPYPSGVSRYVFPWL